MKQGKVMHVFKTMFVTGLAYIVSYGITLVLTPYITETVGAEAYGFVTLAKQFTQYALIITTALNTFAARYIGVAYHQNDIKRANVFFSSVFWGNFVLATAIFIIALAGFSVMDQFIHIPADLVRDVKRLFILTFAAFWVTTFFSAFGCTGYVCDRMDLTGLFRTLSYIADAVVLVIAFAFFPQHIFYVALGTMAAALVVGLSDLWMAKRFLPRLRVTRKDFSLAAVKRLVMDGMWQSFNQVGELLNSGLDLLVCNQMLTSLAMGQLGIAKTMTTIMNGLYLVVIQTFTPRFMKTYAVGDRENLLKELKISMKVSGMLANILFAGFVALGMVYYRLWIPSQDIDLVYKLTIVTILTCIPTGPMQPLYYIYTLTLKKKIPALVTTIGGLFNVAGMYLLIKYAGMGIYAVAWTTVAVMFVINFVTNPLYMCHCLHVPYGTFYPDIARNVLSSIVLVLAFKGLTLLYMPNSWLTLILSIGALALIGVPLHLLIVCNKEQRSMIKEFATSFIKGRKTT